MKFMLMMNAPRGKGDGDWTRGQLGTAGLQGPYRLHEELRQETPGAPASGSMARGWRRRGRRGSCAPGRTARRK